MFKDYQIEKRDFLNYNQQQKDVQFLSNMLSSFSNSKQISSPNKTNNLHLTQEKFEHSWQFQLKQSKINLNQKNNEYNKQDFLIERNLEDSYRNSNEIIIDQSLTEIRQIEEIRPNILFNSHQNIQNSKKLSKFRKFQERELKKLTNMFNQHIDGVEKYFQKQYHAKQKIEKSLFIVQQFLKYCAANNQNTFGEKEAILYFEQTGCQKYTKKVLLNFGNFLKLKWTELKDKKSIPNLQNPTIYLSKEFQLEKFLQNLKEYKSNKKLKNLSCFLLVLRAQIEISCDLVDLFRIKPKNFFRKKSQKNLTIHCCRYIDQRNQMIKYCEISQELYEQIKSYSKDLNESEEIFSTFFLDEQKFTKWFKQKCKQICGYKLNNVDEFLQKIKNLHKDSNLFAKTILHLQNLIEKVI